MMFRFLGREYVFENWIHGAPHPKENWLTPGRVYVTDLAILCAAGATTTLYPSNTPAECAYILADSGTEVVFTDPFFAPLVAKAREGVPVHLIYDWVGCWATPKSFWRPLRRAGVEVRAFNSPRMAVANPFGALQRDHRKLVVVDGDVAYVSGMCVGQEIGRAHV